MEYRFKSAACKKVLTIKHILYVHGQYHAYHMLRQVRGLFDIHSRTNYYYRCYYVHAYVHSRVSAFIIGLLMVLFDHDSLWRDVIREGTFEGMHTGKSTSWSKLGFILLLFLKLCFFLLFLGLFFHNGVSPDIVYRRYLAT
jgi:hypothetical protein